MYFVSMDVAFLEDCTFFLVIHLQGENESEESNSNVVVSIESISLTHYRTMGDPFLI